MEDPIADNPVAREPCRAGNMPPGIVARGNHAAGNGDFGVDGVEFWSRFANSEQKMSLLAALFAKRDQNSMP